MGLNLTHNKRNVNSQCAEKPDGQKFPDLIAHIIAKAMGEIGISYMAGGKENWY